MTRIPWHHRANTFRRDAPRNSSASGERTRVNESVRKHAFRWHVGRWVSRSAALCFDLDHTFRPPRKINRVVLLSTLKKSCFKSIDREYIWQYIRHREACFENVEYMVSLGKLRFKSSINRVKWWSVHFGLLWEIEIANFHLIVSIRDGQHRDRFHLSWVVAEKTEALNLRNETQGRTIRALFAEVRRASTIAARI